jgi:hypothetical protein
MVELIKLRPTHPILILVLTLLVFTQIGMAGSPCIVPDDGSGTAELPPMGCEYVTADDVFKIIEGLPPGTTIEMDGILKDFICCGTTCPNCSLPLGPGECETPGGALGGHGHCFEATLELHVTGTGSLMGFNRTLRVPVFCEVHTGPRNPGAPVQHFDTDMYRLQGELFGDPDFCAFRITAGTDFGLPGPGETTLTELPSGDFAVDSFFDITYQIEFEGCPASVIDGYMGTTTDTVRIETGFADCAPKSDGSACRSVACPNAGENCLPVTVNFDPATGWVSVLECECRPDGQCHADGTGASGLGCVVPDNGNGTADLPPQGCEYRSPDEVYEIIDGLPPGTTIELDGPLRNFYNIVSTPGGTLGGELITFDAELSWKVTGTGSLEGFNRNITMPVSGELHTGPRNPGNPVQTFSTDMFRLQGELFGDPDFCTLRITGGTDYGLPSPGQTTLTELPSGDFAVDSFFDITYQIEFEGCPASQLEDYMGTTTATIRIQTGGDAVPPSCIGGCPSGMICEQTVTEYPNGTIDISCNCIYLPCEPTPDATACKQVVCPNAGDQCQPRCVNYDPVTRQTKVLDCDCRPRNECQVEIPSGDWPCIRPDNGQGTVTLPPIGCEFTSPDETFMIIQGLPPGTTIELDGTHKDFICCDEPCPICSLPLPPGECEMAGGSLGGHGHCFESTLDFNVRGTGSLEGFNRHLAVPVSCEVHTGPRNPGDPVQQFDTDMYRLQGELFGDPDFCALRIVGGTDFGLPSPGQTTLTKLPTGDFAVDSFFDITYQIEFEGCAGSPLDGYMGTTTATIRMDTGSGEFLPPRCTGGCPECEFCDEAITLNPDGTIDLCCDCIPDADLNKDGVVNFEDVAILARQWLRTGP